MNENVHILFFIFSYLPWFKTFYSVLDRMSQLFGDINEDNVSVKYLLYIFMLILFLVFSIFSVIT